jgi:hypothetical protein
VEKRAKTGVFSPDRWKMSARVMSARDSFWNAFVVEMEKFVPEMKVLDQRRPAGPGLERILVVGNWNPEGGG